ncbi:MAG: NIPSNAP family protein, partial [Dehalococcoidia bacterium]|nr:NIPSNAP family protein [Dehalococcoidia bacterium]
MIYETRVYEALPGKLPELHKLVEIAHRLFVKHGMKEVGYWTAVIGRNNQITHLLGYENLADRERRWAAFQADQEWMKAMADAQKNGPIVASITSTILQPTTYSP